ncbi:MAG: hypothetical protein WCP39_07320, partial [Chlamydiota bacterium]
MKKSSLLLCSLFTIPFIHYLATDGFRVDKIIYRQPYLYSLENAPNTNKITNILSQDFLYLGKGRQVYVFESNDHQWVIKFVRNFKYQIPLWDRFLSTIHLISNDKAKTLDEKKIRLDRALKSYQIASDFFSKEEKILFCHLSPNEPISFTIRLVDKIGIPHVVDLSKTVFLIQKKASSVEKILLQEKNHPEMVQKILLSFLHKIEKRTQKNIAKRDAKNYLRNAG